MIKQYIKQALQQLKENTLVSVISIAGTALAIAMMLVMVLVFQINSVGYRPESNRDRLLYVNGTEVAEKVTGSNKNRGAMSAEAVKECFYSLQKPEAVAAINKDYRPVSLPDKRLFKEYQITYTDPGYWTVFDHPFVEGAPFTEADFHSAIPRAVISERVARDLFGSGKAVGRDIVLNYVTFSVCGVVRDIPSSLMASFSEVWIPYTCNETLTSFNRDYGENMIGDFSIILLARSPSDFEAIRTELELRRKQYDEGKSDYSINFGVGPISQLDQAMGSNGFRKVDWVEYMAGAGGFLFFLLLIPALNLTGVIQSSVQKRKEEMGLRKAFGATGRQLLTQVLSENLVLTLIGGVIGIALSIVLLLLGKSFMLDEGVTLTASMLFKPGLFVAALLFTFLLNLLSAGIPAWRTTRQPIVDALKGNE